MRPALGCGWHQWPLPCVARVPKECHKKTLPEQGWYRRLRIGTLKPAPKGNR
jgi:hypothetical protein